MKIAYYVPESIFDNSDFEQLGWTADKIFEKTGIRRRHISSDTEYALDLASKACEKLFREQSISRDDIDYLIYCTQSPDYVVPNNASILQESIGLKLSVAAIDILQGCSGFLYGLSLAKGILVSKQAKKVLLVTADTWSKYINKKDKSTRSIFGDGSSATLLTLDEADRLGEFVFGTDGRGAGNLMVKTSGLRFRRGAEPPDVVVDSSGNERTEDDLYMNGPDIFNFTLKRVPETIARLLDVNKLRMEDIDHFIFHQANGYMLEHLRKKIGIPLDKFPVYLEDVGNTVSSTIPILLSTLQSKNMVRRNHKAALIGFGVGYSWSATVMTF